jgi:hypothetical protein
MLRSGVTDEIVGGVGFFGAAAVLASGVATRQTSVRGARVTRRAAGRQS